MASRPYAEKVAGDSFFLSKEDAEGHLSYLDDDVRDSFAVYGGTLSINKQKE